MAQTDTDTIGTDLGAFDFESGTSTVDVPDFFGDGPEAIPAADIKKAGGSPPDQQAYGLPAMRDAAADPAYANRAAAMAMQDDVQQPIMRPEPEGQVNLLMGSVVEMVAAESRVYRDAVVRELNGADEEAISKSMTAGNVVRFIDVLCHSAVESIGPGAPRDKQIDDLTVGDRDMLVMAIRRATYGDTLTLKSIACPYCEETMTVTYKAFPQDEGGDVPVRKPEDCPGLKDHNGSVREFEIEVPSGRVAVIKIMDGHAHKAVFTPDNENKTMGEINSLMLRECVRSMDGKAVKTMRQVREELSLRDRRFLLQWLSDNQPGPRYEEVVQECVECKREFPLVVDVLTLFRFV